MFTTPQVLVCGSKMKMIRYASPDAPPRRRRTPHTRVGETSLTRMTRPSIRGRSRWVASSTQRSPEGGDVGRPLVWVPRMAPDHTRNTPP